MDQFDKLLRQRAAEEPVPVPNDYAGRVFQTCAALSEAPQKIHRRHWGRWLAAALALICGGLSGRFAAKASTGFARTVRRGRWSSPGGTPTRPWWDGRTTSLRWASCAIPLTWGRRPGLGWSTEGNIAINVKKS